MQALRILVVQVQVRVGIPEVQFCNNIGCHALSIKDQIVNILDFISHTALLNGCWSFLKVAIDKSKQMDMTAPFKFYLYGRPDLVHGP